MQMQRMQIKFPPKHDTRYAQHFSKVNSEPCQASEAMFLGKTGNALKTLKTVITKSSTLGI